MSKLAEKEALQLRLEVDFGLSNNIKLTNDEKGVVQELVEELHANLVNAYLDKNIIEWQEDLNYLLELREGVQTHAEGELCGALVATPVAQRFVDRFRPTPAHKLRDDVELDIVRLKSLLSGPAQERADLREKIEKLTFYISVQQRLPTEILAQIFLQCFGTEHLQIPPNMDLLPWTLGRVCSRWRQVAIGEPRLWNRLTLTGVHRQSVPRVAVFMKHILTKHPVLPISLNVESGSKMSITKNVLPHSSRIRTLSLQLNSPPAVELLDQPSDSFRALESVRLVFLQADGGAGQLNKSSLSLFADAPNLRRVEILIVQHPGHITLFPTTNLHLPWGQLTDISFRLIPPTLVTMVHILQQCHCLINLTLTYIGWENIQPEISQLVLCNLRSFTLDIHYFGGCSAFLRALVFPSLKALYIFSPSWVLGDCLALINHSGPLEIFALISSDGDVHKIEPLIRSMPTVVQISLPKDSYILRTTLAAMASGATLPNIQRVARTVSFKHRLSDLQDIRWAEPPSSHEIPCHLMKLGSIRQGFDTLYRELLSQNTSETVRWGTVVDGLDEERRRSDGLSVQEFLKFENMDLVTR